MKKILIPTDFSRLSENAVRFAIHLAEKMNAEITLLNSFHFEYFHDFQYGYAVEIATLEDKISKIATKRMNEFASRFDTTVKLNKKVTFDSLVTAVKNHVAEEKYDLVVLGTHGASGFEEVFIGSNAERVVRHAPCPVIAIPTQAKIQEVKKILIPLDVREIRTSFLDEISKLQKLLRCKLEFMWVRTPHNIENEGKLRTQLTELFESSGLSHYEFRVVRSIFPSDGILAEVIESNADMIAMATHARRGISHWLSGSLTEDTINHIEVPVWSFKIDKAEKAVQLEAVANTKGKPDYKNLKVPM